MDGMIAYKNLRPRKAGLGFKLTSLFLAAVLLAVLLPLSALAKTKEYEIRLNEPKENYVFSVLWDNTDKQADEMCIRDRPSRLGACPYDQYRRSGGSGHGLQLSALYGAAPVFGHG